MHTKKGAEHCRTAPALRLPGDCGPWGWWGTDKHGELALTAFSLTSARVWALCHKVMS